MMRDNYFSLEIWILGHGVSFKYLVDVCPR